MTLILAFLAAHLGVIVGSVVGLLGVAFGGVRHLQAKAATADAGQKVAQANAQVAVSRDATAQANAKAALSGVQAAKERQDVQNTVDAMPTGAAADQLRTDWQK